MIDIREKGAEWVERWQEVTFTPSHLFPKSSLSSTLSPFIRIGLFSGRLLRSALGRWEALLRFCDDGRIEIDNNAAERALRVVALGRRNFLFAGSDGGEKVRRRFTVCLVQQN
jgi:hypothetical protein